MKQCHITGRENSRELAFPPLLGERAGVRASVSFNLIFGVGASIQTRARATTPARRGSKIACRLLPAYPHGEPLAHSRARRIRASLRRLLRHRRSTPTTASSGA